MLTGHRKFVWNGWLLLMELDGLNDDAVLRKRTWGLDLSGLTGGGSSAGLASSRSMLEGAGGIGGLLAVYDTNGTTTGENPEADDMAYVYFYDANGNVRQVCDLSHTPSDPAGAIVARYEYDPYGNVTSQSGTYAATNPFRFSTKYWDDETGLGYWGYRYYDPKLGRWVNRDPIGELGGYNIHAFVLNSPILRLDALGQLTDCYYWNARTRRLEPCMVGGRESSPWPRCPMDDNGSTMKPSVPDIPRCKESNPICAARCASPGVFGSATCDPETGTNCICVCDYNIEVFFEAGGEKAIELIKRCVAREESSASRRLKCEKGKLPDVTGANISHCMDDIENLKCLKNAINECDTVKCKEVLLEYAKEQKRQCETYGTDKAGNDDYSALPPCPPEDREACIRAYEEVLHKVYPE